MPQTWCFFLLIVLLSSDHAHGFGAGNIPSLSCIEGQNWRHGDIEDALLTLFLAQVAGGRKFSKLDVKRVYLGNWLRDYSQAVDVGTVKYVSAEAIRILVWVLGFMSFGFGTREFEVTTERLGCYQPTEHIDNPFGYAEGEDARCYDCRLRGPVDGERELAVDPRTDIGIPTSAALVRRVLGRSIQLGRRYARSRKDEDLHEALRLMGTGLHCLEDYAAHSNYTELSLIEIGETEVFPHVDQNTRLQVRGAREYVYPIVTGTFGGKSNHWKTSSQKSQNGSPSESFLQDLLSNIPSGLVGNSASQANQMDDFKTKADIAQKSNKQVTPREPEQWTRYLDNVQKEVYPVLEWHDELLKDQIAVFVFSILAPYVLPIINHVKAELETGSSEVIESSREQQHVVFNDDFASDPTHSMLSKDHFSNVLNEPAGRIASNVVKWTVPQLMQCWDNEDVDVDRTLNRIISGVFHHPALREYGDDGAANVRQIMFSTVEKWWRGKTEEEQDILHKQLSRAGVLKGKITKQGCTTLDVDSGDAGIEKLASEAVGGGALGGLVGGLVGGMGDIILDEAGPQSGRGTPESLIGEKHGTRHGKGHKQHKEHKEHVRPHPRQDDSDRHDTEIPPPYSGYKYQSESAYYERSPTPRDDYPPVERYRREEYRQQQQDDSEEGGHHQHERREIYHGGRREYEHTKRYEYEQSQAYSYVDRSYMREGNDR
ncbi:Heterokaryon incompatibility Het-C [Penicillium lagena]|uniref:Heterokaryon incompatibility Het-C n=1 Tax=Penicillium lagena TaxID=94218 RepID=UPI00254129EB|nr:Heterokaryon incompatibility Het-C [Penicillium lagena]KAJ5605079.1 Heterokaryon incompatibility Het-C [Penicillium lagena]